MFTYVHPGDIAGLVVANDKFQPNKHLGSLAGQLQLFIIMGSPPKEYFQH